MIDFTKLRVKTQDERDEDDRRREVQAIADDTARRQIRATKSVEMTLNADAEFRFSLSGDRIIHLRGLQHNNQLVRADWFAPPHLSQKQIDVIFYRLIQGVSVKLDGYWRPHSSAVGTSFTFMTQFIEISPS